MAPAKSLLVCILSLFSVVMANDSCSPLPPSQVECIESLLPGQYYCESPQIDTYTQSVMGCESTGLVYVPCYIAPNVSCGDNTTSMDPNSPAFCRQERCRYVNGQRYSYFVAVALSLFLGMFGIDRFYLGYPAIGLLKLCTIGFFFIGQLVDFLLIVVQAVGPSDRSSYYAAFYGPLINEINSTSPYLEVSSSSCVNS